MPKRNKGPTATELLQAVRKKCMDCCGNMRNEVRDCRIKACPLHGYRRNAIESEGQVSVDETGSI